jgi:transcriptional regulator with XRE-family HTH domain
MAKIAIDVLAAKLKAKRAARGVREVAREIGVSPATYSRVENGNLPDLETFTKLCEWVELDPNDVLDVKTSTDRVQVHLRNQKEMPRDVAIAMGELILKAHRAMVEEEEEP